MKGITFKGFTERCFSFVFLLLVSISVEAQLTGTVRKNFMDTYLQSCYNSQRSASINKSIPDKTIYQYCKCSAVYIADSTNQEFLLGIERGEQKFPTNLLQLASTFCSKNFGKD